MPSSPSITLTQLLVVAAAGFSLARTLSLSLPAAGAHILFFASALVGSVRYSTYRNFIRLQDTHKYFAWLATSCGVPLIAASFCDVYKLQYAAALVSITVTFIFLLDIFAHENLDNLVNLINMLTHYISVIIMVSLSFSKMNPPGIVGIAVYYIGNYGVKAKGEFLGIQRLNIFHVMLAMSYILWTDALEIMNPTPPIKSLTPFKVKPVTCEILDCSDFLI